MREIIFRGKKITDDKFVYGCLHWFTLHGKQKTWIETPQKIYLVDPNTVGEYTGLKDINNINLFEGDIVEILFHDRHIKGEIIFLNGAFSFIGEIELNVSTLSQKHILITGNIHEDPDKT
jgi:hypothetical protein